MRSLPLLERKASLTPGLQVVTHLGNEGETAFAAVVPFQPEGVVAKQADSSEAGVGGLGSRSRTHYYRQEALGFHW